MSTSTEFFAKVCIQMPENGAKIIGTHDGDFHCDESLACALLLHTAEFKDCTVLRTRNKDFLAQCSIVVDVGAEYDHKKNRLDHHQNSFSDTFASLEASYKTRLSSAGLVYKHYGQEIIRRLVDDAISESDLNVIYDRVYKNFIEHIDGIDNGVEEFALSRLDTDVTLVQNYRSTTNLSGRVRRLNSQWNETSSTEKDASQFVKAMNLTWREFVDSVEGFSKTWLPARSIVLQAFNDRLSVHDSGKIMRLSVACPWQEHLFDIEDQFGLSGQIIFVIFGDGKGQFRIQTVGIKGTKFANRKPLMWKGLRDEELSEAVGVPGAIFVHASGFIGGHATEEGALVMAKKSL